MKENDDAMRTLSAFTDLNAMHKVVVTTSIINSTINNESQAKIYDIMKNIHGAT